MIKLFRFASISQFQHIPYVVVVLEKKKQRTLGVKIVSYNILTIGIDIFNLEFVLIAS
jgi:hypothetical protein